MSKTTRFVIEICIILAIITILLAAPAQFLKKSTAEMIVVVERLMDDIYRSDFGIAQETLHEIQENWEKEKGVRAITLEEKYVMDMDNSLTQCEAAIKTEDRSSAYEHASVIKHIMKESLTSISFKFWNIF